MLKPVKITHKKPVTKKPAPEPAAAIMQTPAPEPAAEIETEILKPLPANSENPDNDFKEKGYFIRNNCYYFYEFLRGGAKVPRKISNYTMKIIYHFNDGTNNTKRLIQLQHHTGTITSIEVYNSETTPDKFETILKSKQCSFLGSGYFLKMIFAELMDNEKTAIYLHQLGYNIEHEIYCFSNAIIKGKEIKFINDLGVITDKENLFYLPAHAATNKIDKNFDNDRKFIYKAGNIDFKKYTNLLFAAYGLNSFIAISFLISSLFRDIIIKETGFFPFLFLFGQAGTGKSTFIDLITRLFGEKDTGTAIKGSTVKGIARKCAQRKNAMIFLKEYTNNVDDEIIYFFKNAYDGVTYTIAQQSQDAKTSTFLVESGIILDGNNLPTKENAMFERVIILDFNNNVFTDQQSAAYKELQDEAENGISNIIFEILKHRDYFKAEYKTRFRSIMKKIKAENSDLAELPERILKHSAFILTATGILYDKIKFCEPAELLEMQNKVFIDAIEKNELTTDIKDISIFWDSFNFELQKTASFMQQNKQYLVDLYENRIYIKFKEIYPFYIDYCQRLKINYLDSTTLKKMLLAEKYFIPSTQAGRSESYNKKDFGSCYIFQIKPNPENDFILIGNKQINILK